MGMSLKARSHCRQQKLYCYHFITVILRLTCWRTAVLLITPTTELLRRRNTLLKNDSARSSVGPVAPLSSRSAE